MSHRLARSIGHLAYARRYLVEARGHYGQAADRAPDSGGALDAVAEAKCVMGQYREARKLNAERSGLIGRLSRHDVHAGYEISDSIVISVAVAAGDLPGALSMADLAVGDPIVTDQPMTLCRRVLALALQGRFDAAIAEATGMWEA